MRVNYYGHSCFQLEADGKGGFYIIVTCWNPQCLLRTVTRSLSTYASLTDSDWEDYREMNRNRADIYSYTA